MLILSCLPQADPVRCAAVLHEVPESRGALRVLRPAEGGPPRAVHLRGEAGVSVPGEAPVSAARCGCGAQGQCQDRTGHCVVVERPRRKGRQVDQENVLITPVFSLVCTRNNFRSCKGLLKN